MQASRRSALGLLAAGAALVTRVDPSQAAYGESANIFGKTTNKAGAHAGLEAFAASAHSSCDVACRLDSILVKLHATDCMCVPPGFVPYAGEGYALLLPAKWNPSKEFDFPGVQLRCLRPLATLMPLTLHPVQRARQLSGHFGLPPMACTSAATRCGPSAKPCSVAHFWRSFSNASVPQVRGQL